MSAGCTGTVDGCSCRISCLVIVKKKEEEEETLFVNGIVGLTVGAV